MKTIEVNGKSIKTNYKEEYRFSNGESKKTMKMELSYFGETDEEMLNRLADRYSKITFYYVSTRVRGIRELIAYCK